MRGTTSPRSALYSFLGNRRTRKPFPRFPRRRKTLERDDRADHFAALHRLESGRNVLERDPLADQALEVQFALLPVVQEPQVVLFDRRRSVDATTDMRVLQEELERRDLHHVLGPAETHDARRPAAARLVEGRADRRGRTDHFEREV